MADANEVFHAIIGTEDQSSQTIDHIHKKLDELGHAAHRVGEETEHMHHQHAFFELGEHVDILKEHFGGLRGSIGEVGSSITELLPVFAALGAAATVAGMFETTEHVAEAYAEMAHNAQELGMSAQALHELRAAAKLTDTDVAGMEKSLGRLNRNMGEALAGKNKDLAALFKHLHIDPRSFKTAADALPALADAFEHTQDATMRARMAFALFGKAGGDMIPFLRRGGEEVRKLQKESRELGIDFTPYAESLERYNEDQKKLTMAMGGFTDLLGGKLSEVLAPLIEESTEFVLANREWITGDIAGGVREFADWLKRVPWHEVGEDIRYAAKETGEFVDAIGGAKTVVYGLAGVMALKGVLFLVEPIKEVGQLTFALGKLITKIGVELVAAWAGAGNAAKAAGVEELAAASLSPSPAIHAEKAVVREGEEASKSLKIITHGMKVVKALPFVGAAVEIMPEIMQMLPLMVGVDVEHQPEGSGHKNRWAGQGVNARGKHDYGQGPSGPHAHPQRIEPSTPWSEHIAAAVNAITDHLPRPVWAEHPGYGRVYRPDGSSPQGRPLDTSLEAMSAPIPVERPHMQVVMALPPVPQPDQTRRELPNAPSFDRIPVLQPPPSLPTAPVVPPPQQAPRSEITVRFENAPAGLQVQTNSGSGGPRIRTNLGLNWYDDLAPAH
jgi:hypothetical protein